MSVSEVRETLVNYGVESVGMAGLIASVVGIGPEKLSKLVHNNRFSDLFQLSLRELEKQTTKAVAYKLFALGEIVRKQRLVVNDVKKRIDSPMEVYNLLGEELRYLQREEFRLLLLDAKNGVRKIETISIGTLNSSLVHPREVFKPAIKEASSAIILVHNHPSGDPTPSKEDIEITKRIISAGEIIGIGVFDHVIIGDARYISLKERGDI